MNDGRSRPHPGTIKITSRSRCFSRRWPMPSDISLSKSYSHRPRGIGDKAMPRRDVRPDDDSCAMWLLNNGLDLRCRRLTRPVRPRRRAWWGIFMRMAASSCLISPHGGFRFANRLAARRGNRRHMSWRMIICKIAVGAESLKRNDVNTDHEHSPTRDKMPSIYAMTW